MFLAAKEFPLPVEYRFLPLEEVFHEPPADVADRTLVFLDCGNIDRMPVDFLQRDGARILNIDHHHDNTRFGDGQPGRHRGLLHRRDRLRAGEAARRRDHARDRHGALRRPDHRHRASSCTRTPTPRSHRMAAELIEAGVDVNDIYRRLYERVPIEKLKLVGARAREDRAPRRRPPRHHLHLATTTTRRPAPARRLTEGIIDYVRALEGTARRRASSATRPTAAARPAR